MTIYADFGYVDSTMALSFNGLSPIGPIDVFSDDGGTRLRFDELIDDSERFLTPETGSFSDLNPSDNIIFYTDEFIV